VRILVVEDESRLAGLLQHSLKEEGHVVDVVLCGKDALAQQMTCNYDVIVLDRMLPDIDGLEVCRTLRRQRVQTPILLLTARDAVEDRVAGLDAGADDYLTKPFAFSELAARLRALSRRAVEMLPAVLRADDLRLDPAQRRVWRGEREIFLPNKKFRILEYLLRHPNQVLTRDMIAEHVWDYEFLSVTNVIDVHIRALRKLIDDPYPGQLIQTVRSVGYRVRSS
jgi:two-component system OmpR family response regulator